MSTLRSLFCFHQWKVISRHLLHATFSPGRYSGECIVSRCDKCGAIKKDTVRF